MQEICNSTAILQLCSRVPSKGLPSFAATIDGSWRKHPYLISDVQKIGEPLPSPRLWDCCYISTHKGCRSCHHCPGLQAMDLGLHSLILWLPPVLQESHISTLSPARCSLSPCPAWELVVMGCCREQCQHCFDALTSTPTFCSCLSPAWKEKRLPWWAHKQLLTGSRRSCLFGFSFYIFGFWWGVLFVLVLWFVFCWVVWFFFGGGWLFFLLFAFCWFFGFVFFSISLSVHLHLPLHHSPVK